MVYKIRTGISWRDLPERYGPWETVYTRFRCYALDGVFTRALRRIQAHADAADDIDWHVQIGSTIVRAHQHPATGRKGGSVGRTQDSPSAQHRRALLQPAQGFRSVASRYEKTATSYEASVTLASFLLWARSG
ncbi:transposase [Streptomyces canus]|nr:transposase [Streptomyces sp. RP5T]